MAHRRLKAFRKRPANRFFVSLIAFLLSSWLCYYVLSVIVGPAPANDDGMARQTDSLTATPLVVARFKPSADGLSSQSPRQTLPLLTAEPKRMSAQGSNGPTVVDRVAEQARSVTAEADGLCRAGKLVQARTLVNRFAEQHDDHPAAERVREYALKLGAETILSGTVRPDDHLCAMYTVKAGDTLSKIAKTCKVPYQFLCRINGISDPRRLRAGQQIKLVRGPVNGVVVKRRFVLYLYLQDVLFARYDVGLGKDDRTPAGTWMVEKRVRHPVYTDPDTRKVYAGKDPENPTAGYWIAMKGIAGDAVGRTGFGIHGTIEPESIGKLMSKGCIRLRKKDVAVAFDALGSRMSQITIKP